jgi:hypothetical protein
MVSIVMLVAVDLGVEGFPVSFAIRVTVIGPKTPVGVPETVQLVPLNDVERPGTAGKSVHVVRFPIPPIVLNVCENGKPTSPVPRVKFRKENAGFTTIVTVREAS